MCKLKQETIEDILKLGKIYEVGGAVRDKFLFKDKTKDRDYVVTGIPYKELSKILKSHGKVDLVGRSFGVIKFTQFISGKQHTFDITLPRKEFSIGVGHKDFKVDFDPNLKLEEDLQRRDFTINAMAYSLDDNHLIDPLNGKTDLDNQLLRMVYDESFKDDPLRMLRAIQFAARFNFKIESNTYQAIKENHALINTVSPERIAEELNKMLELSDKPSLGLRLMLETGLLENIMPELVECVDVDQPGGFHKYDVFEHTLQVIDACPPILRLRLAALFHDINKPQHKRVVEKGATFYGHESSGSRTAKKVLKRLRYSNDTIKEIRMLVERHMFPTDITDKGMRRLIRRVGQDLIFDLLDLRRADVVGQGMGGTTEDVDQFEKDIKEEISKKPPFSLSDLEIDGKRIMKMFNLKPTPAVGAILDYLMEQVLDDPSNNKKEILESLAKEYYQNEYIKQNKDKESNA
ncbi:CCA tRNA nucleotidyltransferase [Candidatus Zixiibacteriota bacterium]